MRFILIILLSFLFGCNSNKEIFKGKEGFWRLYKDQNNVWWFSSPQKENIFFLGVTSIRHEQLGINPPNYLSSDYKGNINEWAKITSKKLLEYGFNGSGAWSDQSIHNYLPYTKDLNLSLHSQRNISDPLWEKDIEKAIKEQVKPNDKNMIGYFTDNELNWTTQESNAEKYFEVTSRLLRAYDPNHLILGVRFNKRPSVSILKASIGKVDVHSFNCYSDKIWLNMFKEAHLITGVPIIISEFSFFAAENNSSNPNYFLPSEKQPFGGLVKTQKDRANMFKEFVEQASKCHFIVGTEWFQWNDEPTKGRPSDGESYNFGVVDIYDSPYSLLIEAIRSSSKSSQEIHRKSTNSR